MAFNGSGTFNRAVADFVYDTVISETDMNTELTGFATGLSTCVTKDGQTTLTANIPFSGYKITGYGSSQTPNARTDVPNAGQVQDGSFVWCGTAGGSKNALTLTPTPAITAYATGQKFRFKAGSTASDDAVTVAVSGLTAKAIQQNDAALSASVTIAANKYYEILYDGTAFQLTRLSGDSLVLLDEDDMSSDSATAAPSQQSAKAYIDGRTPLTTQGDIVYRDGSGFARLAAGTAGQFLKTQGASANPVWATILTGASSIEVIVKPTTETVTSSTTLQDDDDFEIAMAANETVLFFGQMSIFGAAAGDFKCAFQGPTDSTGAMAVMGPDTGTSGVTNTNASFQSVGIGASPGTAALGMDGANLVGALVMGSIKTVGTAGNLTFRWAQNASSGTATELRDGSYLVFVRV